MSATELRLDKALYPLKEAAPLLSLSVPQLRRLVRAHKIRSRNTGAMYFIPADAIREYIAGADELIASAS
jgi:excisionase family DNA binding protein